MRTFGKAYVASSFSLADTIPDVEAVLFKNGWRIIDRWWQRDEKASPW